MERWDFVLECKEHHQSGLSESNLCTTRKEITNILRQICILANLLPVLTQEWKYTITVKLEEPLMSNVETLKIPKSWFKNNSKKIQNMQTLYWGTNSENPFITAVNYKNE